MGPKWVQVRPRVHGGPLALVEVVPRQGSNLDTRFRNSIQPTLSTCGNKRNWPCKQVISSLEYSFVTRRFSVLRGTAAGPVR